jgi:pimeloyl-ACP methyl ester carboxylesterase
MENTMATQQTAMAFDDSGSGSGRLVILLPGAGDLRSEYRFVSPPIAAAGYRVVTADLPGHGESPTAEAYTVESTAAALVALIEQLGAGPATVVATSFAPTAAVWAAAERPDLIDGIVAISPHLDEDRSLRGRLLVVALKAAMIGPWAGAAWGGLYRSWYKTTPPTDLDAEIGSMRRMLASRARRRAVAETLTASRSGVAERIERVSIPTLTVFGSADDHFQDPSGAAASVAGRLRGGSLIVDGAGHYPHVEQPEIVADAIVSFLER